MPCIKCRASHYISRYTKYNVLLRVRYVLSIHRIREHAVSESKCSSRYIDVVWVYLLRYAASCAATDDSWYCCSKYVLANYVFKTIQSIPWMTTITVATSSQWLPIDTMADTGALTAIKIVYICIWSGDRCPPYLSPRLVSVCVCVCPARSLSTI